MFGNLVAHKPKLPIPMQDLIHAIATKAGISDTQAQTAFETVMQTIKTKLPDSIGNQLDGLMTGHAFDYGAVAKDKMHDLQETAAEKFEDLKEEAAEKIEDIKEGLKRMF